VIFVISNCPQINNPCNGFNPTPVRVLVWIRPSSDDGYGRTIGPTLLLQLDDPRNAGLHQSRLCHQRDGLFSPCPCCLVLPQALNEIDGVSSR